MTVETCAAMLYADVVDLTTIPLRQGNEMVSISGKIRKASEFHI